MIKQSFYVMLTPLSKVTPSLSLKPSYELSLSLPLFAVDLWCIFISIQGSKFYNDVHVHVFMETVNRCNYQL